MARSAWGDGARFVDLVISVCIADVEKDERGRPRWVAGSDEELLRAGGRWDRKRKRWSRKPASKLLVLRFHRGQESAARWFADWLRRFVANDWKGTKRAWSVLLIGGRRSGKTHVVCALLVVFGILSPKATIWALSPTLETGDELDANFRQMLPRGWYRRYQAKTGRSTTFTLANGTRILLKSAVKPQRLKAGRVDMVLLNEAQELSQLAYVKVRAPIADRGGIVVMTANPPDTAAGRWVEEHYEAARKGEIEAEVFELDPRTNPWINYEALASIGAEVDEKTYQRDVLGLFPPIGDVVFHAYSDRESPSLTDGNVAYPPARFIDITAELTRTKLGHAAGDVPGMDFQLTPHMAATIHRFYRDPKNPDPDDIYEFVVDEVVVEDADELELLDNIEAIPRWRPGDEAVDDRESGPTYRGWREVDDDREAPVHCANVIDASAWWQDGAHTKGRQTDRVLASRRWTHNFRPRPEPEKKNNPDLTERVKTTNARLKSHEGKRRLFIAPHCLRTRKAMRSWENSKTTGQPNRRSDFAHLGDTVSYVTFRFFGKPRAAKKKREYRSIGPRHDRAEMFAR